MNRAQKIAIYNLLITFSGSALVLLTSIMKLPDLVCAIEMAIIFALVCISPLVFRKKPGQVSFDERDAIIYQRAMLIAAFGTFGCVGGQFVVPIIKSGLDGSIPVGTVLTIYIGALLAFVIMKSLVVLIMYAWGGKGEKE